MKNLFEHVTKLLKNIYLSIFINGFSLIISQGIFYGFTVYFLTPLINYVISLSLAMSGFSYITLNNIGKFLFYPFTILMILFLFVLLGVVFLFEGIYLITYFSLLKQKHTSNVVTTYLMSFKSMWTLIRAKRFELIPLAWIVTISFNIPLMIYVVKKVRYFRIAFEGLKESMMKQYIFIVVVALILYVVFRNIYSYVFRMVRNTSLQETKEYLRNIDDNEKIRTVAYFALWNGILSIVSYLIYLIAHFTGALISLLLKEPELVMVAFITINDRMALIIGIMITMIGMIGNYSLLSNLIFKYGIINYRMEEYYIEEIKEISKRKIHVPIVSRVVSYKKLALSVIVMLALVNAVFMYSMLNNGSAFNFVGLDSTKITSHRGFSKDTPENTLSAIQKAIDEKADYIEVDVRQTKDGELVILHDENLKRTTGLNKKIWQVDYEEVESLDAGSWFSSDFKEEKVPTLREVFELAKGKVNLNLDLKYNKNYHNFEEQVVALIEEFNMERQSNVSSTKLSVLRNIKKLNSNIKTGYIIYQVNDSYYDLEEVDFFSINSYFISERLLKLAHESGKEVHAWTVNTRNELERLNRLGVDNIITDNPAYAKFIILEAESDPVIISMLKSILRY